MVKYDAIIVGSGPAGLEAALNLKVRNKRFLLFGSAQLSKKIQKAPRIDNYLGLPSISGKELAEHFLRQIRQMEIAITEETVSTIYPMGDYFAIATNKNTYESHTIILATGSFQAKPLPGEEEFLGRGVGYCATCDAMLYKGKTVAVVGFCDEAVEEANFISDVVGKVYYIPVVPLRGTLRGNIEVVPGPLVEIRGNAKANALVLKDREIAADGIFLLRDSIAPGFLVPGIELEGGYINVDKHMRTNLPGCYAAGDCTGKPHQYMKAAGQGQTAALNAVAYIDSIE